MYHIRKTTLPSVPTSLDSITIPDIMSFTHSHEQLLICNTNAPHKVIAFALESSLIILSKKHRWNAIGTVRTVPSLFSRAHYIHVWDKYNMQPIVYSCCQDKSGETYVNLYQSLVLYATKKALL